jgi:hypothetical protein
MTLYFLANKDQVAMDTYFCRITKTAAYHKHSKYIYTTFFQENYADPSHHFYLLGF